MIVPNVAFDLVFHLVILASGLPKTSGTIYCYVRRKSDGKWLKADGTWTASTTAPTGADVPTATHTKAGLWKLTLSSATTTGLGDGEVLHAVALDSETEASATVVSDCVQEAVHLAALFLQPNTILDTPTYNSKGLMTSARVRVFPTKADADAETNVMATFTVTGTAQAAPNDHLGSTLKTTRTP